MQIRIKTNGEIKQGTTESYLVKKFKTYHTATAWIDGKAYIVRKQPRKTAWTIVKEAN
jgi:ribosomal protein L24E